MKLVLPLLGGILSLFACSVSEAYDAETHALITYKAWQRSVLAGDGSGSMREALGIDRLDVDAPFNPYWTDPPVFVPAYFDAKFGDAFHYPLIYPEVANQKRRRAQGIEQCQMQRVANAGWISFPDDMMAGPFVLNFPIQNWLIRGAVREDDLAWWQYIAAAERCGTPDPDPWDPNPLSGLTRVMNHFYDPIHNVPLTTGCELLGPCKRSVDWALGYQNSFDQSPTIDSNRTNHFTYVDARNYEWLALVGERNGSQAPYTAAKRSDDAVERFGWWASTFRSLGDVVHLLQDGAQPQHVRNDAHSPASNLKDFQITAFEAYTNSRVVSGQEVNRYIRGFFDPLATAFYAPTLEFNDYPPVQFGTPLRFFTTRLATDDEFAPPDARFGLMDYTNRGFFTAGTLPGTNSFNEPIQPVDEAHQYTKAQVPCKLSSAITSRVSVNCVHWMHSVLDNVVDPESMYVDVLPHDPGQASPFTDPPLVTESVFANALVDPNESLVIPKYALGLEEFQTTANLAIPRAIAYSAGLVDYFFRGRLAVSAPPDGLISVLDQGIPHHVVDGVPLSNVDNKTFGFTTIRLRVRNQTGDQNGDLVESGTHLPVPQTMAGYTDWDGNKHGQLVAVARYHRNPCYQPDLSGEYAFQEPDQPSTAHYAAGCSASDEIRTMYSEISVSAPVYVDGNGDLIAAQGGPVDGSPCANIGNINTGADSSTGDCQNASALVEFNFSNDPIPINATDLFIQIAYRGRLGDEPDGIAVGILDVLEPSFFSALNTTDWFLYNGQWIPSTSAPPDADASSDPLTYLMFCFNKQKVAQLESGDQLGPGEFTRVALLTAKQDLYMGVVNTFESESNLGLDPVASPLGHPSSSLVRQSDKDNGGTFDRGPMFYGRGTTLGFAHAYSYHYLGDYDETYYPALWNLTPELQGPEGPGLPRRMLVQFTSASDNDCKRFYPGTWPDAYLNGAARSVGTPLTMPAAGGVRNRRWSSSSRQ